MRRPSRARTELLADLGDGVFEDGVDQVALRREPTVQSPHADTRAACDLLDGDVDAPRLRKRRAQRRRSERGSARRRAAAAGVPSLFSPLSATVAKAERTLRLSASPTIAHNISWMCIIRGWPASPSRVHPVTRVRRPWTVSSRTWSTCRVRLHLLGAACLFVQFAYCSRHPLGALELVSLTTSSAMLAALGGGPVGVSL